MDDADDDRVQTAAEAGRRRRSISVWLLVEIAKANWAVTKIILSPNMPIRQHFFAIPYTQKTDLGQVIFANSITLTPGTITIETEPDTFLVHAVAYTDDDIAALADMDRRVSNNRKSGRRLMFAVATIAIMIAMVLVLVRLYLRTDGL